MSTPPVPNPSSLAEAAAALRASVPEGLNGIHALVDGTDAFAARLALVEGAKHSIDLQYYIWHDDLTGGWLLDALCRAADRGVRVRLLLDDNNTSGMDGLLAAVAGHPGLELKLFNPYRRRWMRVTGLVAEFSRLNRRMHNKALIADGVTCVVGGRNIGDEYFDAGSETGFIDLDVLVVGPVVAEVAASFEAFWLSDASHPASRVLRPPSAADRARLLTLGGTVRARPEARRYAAALRGSALLSAQASGAVGLEWAPARLVADEPGKAVDTASSADTLLARLVSAVDGEPAEELLIVSPYLVPGDAGLESLLRLSARGVKIRVLTNALEATDVGAVHAGYVRYREALVRGGIRVFELRRASRAGSSLISALRGGSAASLHAKTFAVDRERIFVGSFNFDPRSAIYNTENGLMIRSPRLAAGLAALFDGHIPAMAYEVRIGEHGRLEWVAHDGAETRVLRREPGLTTMRALGLRMLSWLPFEKLL